jgi:hypothetical protein
MPSSQQGTYKQLPFEQVAELRNVARYASSLIKRQPLGGFSIALVGIAVHIGDRLLFASVTLNPPSIAVKFARTNCVCGGF